MKILVSGGTGFVGRYIVEDLLAAGHAVTVMGRTPPAAGYFSAPVRFVEGALDPDLDQRQAFDRIDAFIHAAFDHAPGKYRGGEGGDPDGFRRKNLDGSLALFREVKQMGVGRAVFLSSRAVHGKISGRPDTLYGEVKLATENALADMASPDFRVASLRLTGIYGPAEPGRPHKWAELFRDYLAGKPIPPRAGTEVHGLDAAAAVRLALMSDEALGRVPLEASDILVDRRDILGIVQHVAGSPHPLPERADASAIKVMDAAGLRSLGWNPGGWPLLRETVESLARDAIRRP